MVSVGYDVTTTSAIPFHFQSVTCDPAETELCNCTKDVNVNSTCIRDEAVYIECVVPGKYIYVYIRLVSLSSPGSHRL